MNKKTNSGIIHFFVLIALFLLSASLLLPNFSNQNRVLSAGPPPVTITHLENLVGLLETNRDTKKPLAVLQYNTEVIRDAAEELLKQLNTGSKAQVTVERNLSFSKKIIRVLNSAQSILALENKGEAFALRIVKEHGVAKYLALTKPLRTARSTAKTIARLSDAVLGAISFGLKFRITSCLKTVAEGGKGGRAVQSKLKGKGGFLSGVAIGAVEPFSIYSSSPQNKIATSIVAQLGRCDGGWLIDFNKEWKTATDSDDKGEMKKVINSVLNNLASRPQCIPFFNLLVINPSFIDALDDLDLGTPPDPIPPIE